MTDSPNDPMNENDDIASALGGLPREMAPPAALEEATVASLRNAGLLGAKAPQTRITSRTPSSLNLAPWVLAASIGAIAFVGGSVYQSTRPQPAHPIFALTVYSDSSTNDSSSLVNHASEIEQWAVSSNASATRNGSASVRPAVDFNADSIIVEEEPVRPAAKVTRTYYVEVPTKDSALSIARKCPLLKYGGRVEVTEVPSKTP
jgi:hypothetical protein